MWAVYANALFISVHCDVISFRSSINHGSLSICKLPTAYMSVRFATRTKAGTYILLSITRILAYHVVGQLLLKLHPFQPSTGVMSFTVTFEPSAFSIISITASFVCGVLRRTHTLMSFL